MTMTRCTNLLKLLVGGLGALQPPVQSLSLSLYKACMHLCVYIYIYIYIFVCLFMYLFSRRRQGRGPPGRQLPDFRLFYIMLYWFEVGRGCGNVGADAEMFGHFSLQFYALLHGRVYLRKLCRNISASS